MQLLEPVSSKLNPINDIRVGVKFTHAGLIGPKYEDSIKVKALVEIKKEQKGWLDITYLRRS